MSEEGMGHNNPPTQLEFAESTAAAIDDWLKIHPIIQKEEEAKEYKLLRDRGKCCLADMEDERTARTRHLLDEAKQINSSYGPPKVLLEKVLGEGDNRLNDWIKQEEERRRKITEEVWKKVHEAEEQWLAAKKREDMAIEEAAAGVEVGLLAAARDAEKTKQALERAEREVMRAERNEAVKVTGGYRRALSAREQTKFIIRDPIMVVNEIGWSDRLYEALERDIREHYRNKKVYPSGVQITSETKVQ